MLHDNFFQSLNNNNNTFLFNFVAALVVVVVKTSKKLISISRLLMARKWMAAGPAGRGGVAAQPVFAREINASEQEPAPIQLQVKMELIVKEIAHSKKTAWVSCCFHNSNLSWSCQNTSAAVVYAVSVVYEVDTAVE